MKKRRTSISQQGNRTYEIDEDGSAAGDNSRRNSMGGAGGGGGSSDAGAVLKQGWLDKRGEVNTAWKPRYFVLTQENPYRDLPKMLHYYKDEEAARMGKGGSSIECGPSTVVRKTYDAADDDHQHCFDVTLPTRTYSLAAPNALDLSEWVQLIEQAGIDLDDEQSSSHPKMLSRDASASNASISSMASFAHTGPLVEVHSGWMKKKGQGVFGSKMQKRYFVLYDNKELHYFEGASMDTIQRKGRIQMSEATGMERTKPGDRKDFSFCIKVPGRDWVLDPGGLAQYQEWEQKLMPMITFS